MRRNIPTTRKTSSQAAGKKTAGRPRRINGRQADEAAALSEAFHGRPARKITEVEEPADGRTTLTDLGRLVALTIRLLEGSRAGASADLAFTDDVRLCASPDGRGLYLVGGDQTLDLGRLGLGSLRRDYVLIGQAKTITYHTRKAFHNFEQSDYIHKFGEDGGTLPIVGYDTLNGRLFLIGGSYKVKPEGIVN